MKLIPETVSKVVYVLSEIGRNSTIKFSRSPQDFNADRLRMATTAPDLLTAINRYSELLGSDVLTGQAIENLINAAAAPDAHAAYLWLRDLPSVAVGLTMVKHDERQPVIDALCIAFDAKETVKVYQKRRRPFDINITALVTEAVAHGDDAKTGNAQLFRRCDVRGGMRLPFYSGNAIGGAMRDLLADHFLQALGLRLDKADPAVNTWFFHLLYSGGIMADGAIPKEFERTLTGAASGTMRSDGVRQLRNMIPFFSMMGGIGKTPMESYVHINDLRPECLEWGTGDESVDGMMTWRYLARRDDFEGRTSKAQLKEGDSQAETANTSMLANTECLAEGVVLEGGIDLSRHMTDIEASALACGLLLLQDYGYIGGKKKRGYGRVDIEYKTDVLLDPKPYEDYLAQNKDTILDYLYQISALPKPGAVEQPGLI